MQMKAGVWCLWLTPHTIYAFGCDVPLRFIQYVAEAMLLECDAENQENRVNIEVISISEAISRSCSSAFATFSVHLQFVLLSSFLDFVIAQNPLPNFLTSAFVNSLLQYWIQNSPIVLDLAAISLSADSINASPLYKLPASSMQWLRYLVLDFMSLFG